MTNLNTLKKAIASLKKATFASVGLDTRGKAVCLLGQFKGVAAFENTFDLLVGNLEEVDRWKDLTLETGKLSSLPKESILRALESEEVGCESSFMNYSLPDFEAFIGQTVHLEAPFAKLFFSVCGSSSSWESRAVMHGLNVGPSYIGFTDGRRAMYRAYEYETDFAFIGLASPLGKGTEPMGLQFPWKEAKNLWNKKGCSVTFQPEKGFGKVVWDLGHGIQVWTTVHEGRPPNLEKVIPQSIGPAANIPAGSLKWLKAAKKNLKDLPRSPYLVEALYGFGALQFSEHKDPTVINREPIGEQPCSFEMRFGFNACYMLEFLEAYGERASIRFQPGLEPTKSMVMRGTDPRDEYILMPVRLRDLAEDERRGSWRKAS